MTYRGEQKYRFERLKSHTRLIERRRIKKKHFEPLNEYLFIDRPRLKSYSDQLEGPVLKKKIPSWNISLSFTGPRISGNQSVKERSYTEYEMIQNLIDYLDQNNLLASFRPKDHHDIKQVFVLEQMTAVKAIFPIKSKKFIDSLKEIAVWVSGPSSKELDGSRGYSEGTFLYLVEAYWDSDQACQTTYSAFSALDLIMSELERESKIVDLKIPFSIGGIKSLFSRSLCIYKLHYFSPIDTLRTLGATIQPPRKIEVLYRKRYLTDEQHFKDQNGNRHRSNDLFAYPIFIKDLN